MAGIFVWVFFSIEVLKWKLLEAWKVCALDICFSPILWLSAEMTMCKFCNSIFLVPLELFSETSEWSFTGEALLLLEGVLGCLFVLLRQELGGA